MLASVTSTHEAPATHMCYQLSNFASSVFRFQEVHYEQVYHMQVTHMHHMQVYHMT